MSSARKPLIIVTIILAAVGLAFAGFWVLKTLYDQPVDAYSLTYRLEGLSGAEDIEYRSSPSGYAEDVSMQAAHATGASWSQEAVVGADDEAQVTVVGSASTDTTCSIVRDAGTEFEKKLTVTTERVDGNLVCRARPRS